MLGETPIKEIEDALSNAVSASLRFKPYIRPAFIASFLLGREWTDARTNCAIAHGGGGAHAAPNDHLQIDPPEDIEAELEHLNHIVRNAVDSAARRPDYPLKRIADFLLRTYGPDGVGLHFDEDEHVDDPPVQIQPAKQMAVWSDALARVPQVHQSSVVAVNTATLASRGTPRSQAAALAKLSGGGVATSSSTLREVPELGSRPSVVTATLIGAIEEAAAKRSAKEVDSTIINQAMKKKNENKGMGAEDTFHYQKVQFGQLFEKS